MSFIIPPHMFIMWPKVHIKVTWWLLSQLHSLNGDCEMHWKLWIIQVDLLTLYSLNHMLHPKVTCFTTTIPPPSSCVYHDFNRVEVNLVAEGGQIERIISLNMQKWALCWITLARMNWKLGAWLIISTHTDFICVKGNSKRPQWSLALNTQQQQWVIPCW